MPVDKQVIERYRVLNECFRNPYRDYTIEDLVDEIRKNSELKAELFDMEAVPGLVFGISDPEEVTP